jgi:hypothetical protein
MEHDISMICIFWTPVIFRYLPLNLSETLAWQSPTTKGKPPSARYAHSATLVGSKLFIFGGCGENSVYNELLVLDLRKTFERDSKRFEQ